MDKKLSELKKSLIPKRKLVTEKDQKQKKIINLSELFSKIS